MFHYFIDKQIVAPRENKLPYFLLVARSATHYLWTWFLKEPGSSRILPNKRARFHTAYVPCHSKSTVTSVGPVSPSLNIPEFYVFSCYIRPPLASKRTHQLWEKTSLFNWKRGNQVRYMEERSNWGETRKDKTNQGVLFAFQFDSFDVIGTRLNMETQLQRALNTLAFHQLSIRTQSLTFEFWVLLSSSLSTLKYKT